jgi:hypothetical protein
MFDLQTIGGAKEQSDLEFWRGATNSKGEKNGWCFVVNKNHFLMTRCQVACLVEHSKKIYLVLNAVEFEGFIALY